MLHPTIRVLALVLLAAALPSLPLPDLALLAAGLTALLARLGRSALGRFAAGLLRLRWLLLAIVVLYWGFTPGEAIHPSLPGLSREGILEGARRMLVLADLLAAVHLLLAATPLDELCGALTALVRPLRLLGVDTDRFARRLGLVLREIGDVQALVRDARMRSPASLLEAAAAAVREIETRAGRPDGEDLSVPVLAAVPVWQWLLLPALGVVLHLAVR